MVKKTAIVLFFLFISGAIFAQQNDFYGRWVSKYTEDDISVVITFTFSASSFNGNMMFYEGDTVVAAGDQFDAEITSWSSSANTDNATRTDYPNGYIVNISEDGEDFPLEIFISRNRRQLTIPDLNDEVGEILVFTKQ